MMEQPIYTATSKMNNEQLLQGLEKLVKSERKLMHIILSYIYEVEVRGLHLDLGYDSIFKFLTDHHGYSEDAAYARMHGARLLAKVPTLQEKLEEGSISLTQISKVCSAIRAEKKCGKTVSEEQTLDLLNKIENQTLFETRKIIAVELDQPIIEAQSVKPQKDESFLIQVTLNRRQFEAFKKAQSLISHSVSDGSIAAAIEHLSILLIKKVEGRVSTSHKKAKLKSDHVVNEDIHEGSLCRNDAHSKTTVDAHQVPARKANDFGTSVPAIHLEKLESSENVKREPKLDNPTQRLRVIRRRRKYISVKVRRQLMVECKSRCSFEHPQTGFVCESDYQLQVDHIIPFCEGGSDEVSNLRMMCGVHNRDRNRVRQFFSLPECEVVH